LTSATSSGRTNAAGTPTTGARVILVNEDPIDDPVIRMLPIRPASSHDVPANLDRRLRRRFSIHQPGAPGCRQNLAAAFDFDLSIADRPRHPAGRPYQEPVANDQIAFKAAAYVSFVDRCRPLEQATLGNLDSAAVGQFSVDTAFDDQLVAGIDFS
jgi:hypothetical protein